MPQQIFNIKIEGIEELQKQLIQMPERVKRTTLLRILRSGSRVVVDSAKHEVAQIMEKAFSEGRTPTGNLYESIGQITSKSIDYPNIQVGARVKRGYKGYHVHWVNYGTKIRKTTDPGVTPRTRKAGLNRGSMRGNPFMERAFGRVEVAVNKNLTGAVAKYVTRIAKETIIPKY